ncbi:MAG: non-ribosomal peptide synthetase, partial [Hyphomicrobiaceae bacterium]
PIDNVSLAVLDEANAAVQAGAEGELWIAGAGVGAGYLGRDDLNHRSFVDVVHEGQVQRVYRTGDRVRWRDDGTLEFLGRRDHQVKLRGLRVELGEIETALGCLPEVREAVALVREDGGTERRLVGYLQAEPGSERPSAARLRERLMQEIPDYFVPSVFVWLEGFPNSANGKVDRKALPPPPPVARKIREGGTTAAGEDEVARIIGAAWCGVLQRPRVDIDENFFDAGGTSLGLAEVQAVLGRRLNRKVPIVLMFANPTIRSLAAALSAGPEMETRKPGRSPERAARARGAINRARARRKEG